MNSLNELFEDSIKDIHNAEKQLLKALPKLAKSAQHPMLRRSIENHMVETEGQIKRLEEVARIGGFKPTGMVCKGMQGLIEEANEHMKEGKPGPVMDAEIIASAQKAEHYEICAYGTAKAWAEQLGMQECVMLLDQTLKEEEKTDQLLNRLAESEVNQMAARAPQEEPKKSVSKSSGRSVAGKTSTSGGARKTTTRASSSRSKEKASAR